MIINTWPESQICMECVHGEFMIDEPGVYICLIDAKINSQKCKKMRKFLEEEEIKCQ